MYVHEADSTHEELGWNASPPNRGKCNLAGNFFPWELEFITSSDLEDDF